MGFRNSYAAQYKARVVRELLSSKQSLSEIAQKYGVSRTLLSRWKRQALEGLHRVFDLECSSCNTKQLVSMENRLEMQQKKQRELEAESAWLSTCFKNYISREKRLMIAQNSSEDRGGVSMLKKCELLGVPRSSVYYSIANQEKNEKKQHLKTECEALITDLKTRKPDISVCALVDECNKSGLSVSRYQVSRILEHMNL